MFSLNPFSTVHSSHFLCFSISNFRFSRSVQKVYLPVPQVAKDLMPNMETEVASAHARRIDCINYFAEEI